MKPTQTDTTVADTLIAQIQETGPITVSEYMDIASRAYYSRDKVFGKDGDFVTAPEISQVFGELVGLWSITAWQALSEPRNFQLVELGPGRGTLMADLMRTTSAISPKFTHSASLHLIERSPSLRSKQSKTLSSYNPEWHTELSTIPDGPLIIIGNEFLDALPVEQFVKTSAGWCERLVTHLQNGFAFTINSLPSATVEEAFYDAEDGSVLEQSVAVTQVATEIGRLCAERPAIALFIDYGHTTSSIGETLQAVKQHKYYPVLDTPGEADLTAHVDFAAIAQAARAAGASIHGPVEQGLWLKRLGIEVRQAQLAEGKTESERSAIRSSINRLINPEHMGTLFKAIAFTPPGVHALAGFEAYTSSC